MFENYNIFRSEDRCRLSFQTRNNFSMRYNDVINQSRSQSVFIPSSVSPPIYHQSSNHNNRNNNNDNNLNGIAIGMESGIGIGMNMNVSQRRSQSEQPLFNNAINNNNNNNNDEMLVLPNTPIQNLDNILSPTPSFSVSFSFSQ